MGLDVVELVMRVEEEFDIEIFDEEASQLYTVGQLHTCVLSKLGLLASSRCQSSRTFYQVRRALTEMTGVSRRAIRPATATDSMLPPLNRRANWNRLAALTGAQLPPLELARRAKLELTGAIVAVTSAVLVSLWTLPPAPICGVTIALGCALVWRLSRHTATQLPANCATVGQITTALIQLNYGMNVDKGPQPSQDEVWDKLKEVLADELGADPAEVTPDAQFVRDLGLS